MFENMDGTMRALAKKMTQWEEHLHFAVKFARQKLSNYYAEVTPITGMILSSAHILDPFRKLRLFRKWAKGMDINHQDKTSYTTQYQKGFLKYVENEYFCRHWWMLVIYPYNVSGSNLFLSAKASGFGESSFNPCEVSKDDEEWLTRESLAETTPRQRDSTAHLLTAARLYLNSPPDASQNWGHVNPNLTDYHSYPMKIGSTFWLPDITNTWC